ncbi:hypothetical protein V8D89_010921 [Ganoderma adspersum]
MCPEPNLCMVQDCSQSAGNFALAGYDTYDRGRLRNRRPIVHRGRHGPFDNIDLIEAIHCATDKREILLATMRMALFSSFPRASPIRLYGIARRISQKKEVKLASSRTLTLNRYPEVMAEHVALEPKHREKLVTLHYRRRNALAEGQPAWCAVQPEHPLGLHDSAGP